MTKYNSFKDLFADLKKDDSFWTQKAIVEFSVELTRLMDKRGITKKEFAKKINSSQAYVTKVFRGNANFTIETMVKLARALDGNISLHITPKEEKTPNWYRAIDGKLKQPTRVPTVNWGARLASEVLTDTTTADYHGNIDNEAIAL
jgi:transcriptional regulator with XRE-family HTH domain